MIRQAGCGRIVAKIERLVERGPLAHAIVPTSHRAVLDSLVEERAISEELRSRMLGWRYSGFSVLSEFAQRAKAAWARLIRKIYEADPLE